MNDPPSSIGTPDVPSEWDGVWDRGALRRLLGLAGPEAAAEILHHLRADLETACTTLGVAQAARDGDALRRTAHVLIALCGTVGATALCAVAEQLHRLVENRATDAPDEALQHASALIGGVALLCAALADEAGVGL